MADFDTKLDDFLSWLATENPAVAEAANKIVMTTYVSQFGAVTQSNPAANTASKLSDLINSIGNTYLNSVSAYYLAKQKVADLKFAAQGSPLTQAGNIAQGAIGIPPTNLLMWGALGFGAVLILSRR